MTDEVVVAINGNAKTEVYDATEKTVAGFEVVSITQKGSLYKAEYVSLKDSVKAEAAGTDAGTYKMGLTNDSFKNTNVNFTNVRFDVTDGSLEIGKRPVTITVANAKKDYGAPDPTFADATLKYPNYNGENKAKMDKELAGISLAVTRSDAGNEKVGEHEGVLVISSTADDLNNNNKYNNNYSFTVTPGNFTIEKNDNSLTVTAENYNDIYDGAEHGVVAVAKVNGSETNKATIRYMDEDGQYSLTESPKYTDVKKNSDGTIGSYTVEFQATLDGITVTGSATVTINPRKVTLTSETASKVYDGTPLTRPKVTGGDDFVAGEVSDIKATGSVTYVTDGPNKDGVVTNTIEYTPAEGKFNSDNYTITKSEGKLKVTPVTDKVTVTITGHKDTVTYDGAEHSVSGYDVDIKREGTAPDQNGNNLYTESDFTFNGAPIAKDTIPEVTGTDAKTYEMGLAKEKFTNTNANFTNVVFSVTDGLLTINKRPVKITANDNSVTYDGQAHGKNLDAPYTVEQAAADNNRGLVNATVGTKMQTHAVDSNTVEITFTVVKAGTYTGKLEIKKAEPSKIRIMNGTNDVTANYEIELAAGTLTISQRPVTVKARKLSYPYNGAAHPAESETRYEVEGELVDGDVLDAAVLYDNQDQQMLIGDYAAVVTEVTIKNKQEEITGSYKQGTVTGNYAIAVVPSTLHITGDEPLKPTKKTKSVQTNYTVGDKITYTITVKNVSKNEAEGVVVTDSMAEIQPRANYTVSEDKHTAMLDPIPAGGTVIVYAEHVVTAEDVEKAVKETNGTLTNVANIKFGDWSKDAIGNPDKLNDTYEYVVHYYWNNTDNTEIHDSMTYTAQVGTDVTELAEKIWDAERKSFEEGVTGYTPVNTTEKPSTVTLTISADKSKNVINFYYYKNVELTANSNTFVYDGTEKSVSGFTVKDANEAVVSDAEFASRITAGAAGIKADTYPAVFIKADKSDGIEAVVGTVDNTGKYIVVDTTDGKLVIKPITDKVTVTVTENGDSVVYDGNEHTVYGYKSMTANNELYDVTTSVKATEKAAWTAKGTNVGKYPVGIVADDFENTNKNFTNVEFVIVDGELEITPRKVTLTSASGSKKYDGTPLTRPDVTIEGSFVEGEVSDIKATGSVTYVSEGEVDNLITFKKNEGFKDSNYGIEEKIGKLFIEPLDVTIIITGPSAIRGYEPGVTHTIVTGGSELDFVYGSDKVDGKIGVKGMVKGDKILPGTLKHTLEGMYVGEYEGVFTRFDSNGKQADKPTVMHDGVDVTENYKFSYNPGKLTITGNHTEGEKDINDTVQKTEYLLGQKIPFTITVKSVSNKELTEDITVTDPTATILPDPNTANPAYTVSENVATIARLDPQAEVIVYAEHEVTEDNIINGYTNVATINYPQDKPVIVDKETEIEEANPKAELVKEIVLRDGQDENHKFKLGETVYFKITVTNTGNVTLKDYEVKEVLPGAAFIEGMGTGYTIKPDTNKTVAIIEELKPVKAGEEATESNQNQIVLYAQYTIKEEDLGNKELKNIVTADNSKPGEVPIPVDEAKSVSGQKIWKDEGNAFNTRPASITLTLMRKLGQDGAAEQYRTMQLGSNGSWRYSFDHLPKHDAQENEYFYWVVEEPVTGYDTAYETKDESRCDIVNTLQSYQLTIRYWIHTLGETKMDVAFPDYTATLYYNQTYDVVSPEREGTALDDISQARITGTMPLHDVVIDVYYHRIAYRLTIHYIYQDGTTAHEDYTWTYWFNDDYEVPSPIIPGFTPSIAVVAGKMPSRGLEITVVYVGNGEIVIPDEDTTLGFKTYLNAGECFE